MSDKKQFTELLTRDAKNGKLGRRDFMRFAVAAGMSVPLASGLWVSDVAASTPKKGGKFRVGVHDMNTSDTHDTGKYQAVGQIQLAHAHRSYLTEITADNGLGPDMADSWSASPDAKVWTFELNKNATFHNGKKFTAKDAIASLNHHRGEDSTSGGRA
jgi:peptide/nickel transport system substrate-binding protein